MTPAELPSENFPQRSGDETEIGNDALASDLERTARQLSARLARQNDLVQQEESKSASPFPSKLPEYSVFGMTHDDVEDDVFEDDEAALRWRHALLRLSETFLDAAEERRDLSPILLGALHNALEQLLIHGEEADLMALEDWLSHEADASPSTPDGEREERRTSDFLMAGENGIYSGEERRSGSDRRSFEQRRQAERRG